MFDTIIGILTNNNPSHILPALIALALTFTAIWLLKGRFWAFVYVALIPFLNWTFGVIGDWQILAPGDMFAKGVALHPMTMVTGLVFVIRDFVQRNMGHRVLFVMMLAIAWSFYYAWPVIALASGLAFAISETVDWLLFTFAKYKLSTRILLSSALAAPLDTTVFLYGADLARQMAEGAEPGNLFHLANWVMFIIGKMVGAVIVSAMVRRRENAGTMDAYETRV